MSFLDCQVIHRRDPTCCTSVETLQLMKAIPDWLGLVISGQVSQTKLATIRRAPRCLENLKFSRHGKPPSRLRKTAEFGDAICLGHSSHREVSSLRRF